MKTLRLYAATLLAIKTFVENEEPFSAFDITNFIQNKLGDGEWELFSGSSQAKHSTIRGYVREIMDNELLTFGFSDYHFSKKYVQTTDGLGYKQYSVEFDQDNDHDNLGDDFDDLDGCDAGCCPEVHADNTTVSSEPFTSQHTVSIQNNVGRIIVESGRVEIQFS